MKTLTLTSEFFQNECAESFLKSLQGNTEENGNCFCGYSKRAFEPFISNCDGDIYTFNEITFKLDDSFSVDLPCLQNYGMLRKHMGNLEISKIEVIRNDALKYLATLQGVIIEEAGE